MGSCDGSMKKRAVSFVVLLIVLSLGLTLVPHVSGTSGAEVLSYSWYIDSLGYLVVVGEVQNTGQSTIDSLLIVGTIYTIDGQPQADAPAQFYVKYLVPQQKAPFYMEFNPGTSYTSDLSWVSIGLDHVDFKVAQAETTSSYAYPDVVIKSHSGAADSTGVYWVTGTVQNTGNQAAKNIVVYGTFFNATGSVVAMGYSNTLTPASLSPSGVASFKLGAFDLNQTVVPSSLKISSYSLLIQAQEPILSGTPPAPATTPSPDTTPTDTSPSDTTPSDSNTGNSTPWSTYAIVAIAVIFGIVGAILLLRRRKARETTRRRSQVRVKPKAGKRYRS